MFDIEMIFGPAEYDPLTGYDGQWRASKNKDSFIRYYSAGWREVIHKRNDHWTLSIGRGDTFFQVGYKEFDGVRQAKHWADNRDMDDFHILEQFVEMYNERYR